MYQYKSQKRKYKGAYEYLKTGERVFTLTSEKDIKDVKKFSSPQAAKRNGWVKVTTL